LGAALRRCRGALLAVGGFTFIINLLMLTGPLFMLQIYDRVLTSRSLPTLAVLAALTVALYVFQGIFDIIRGRVLLRIGASMADALSLRVHDAILRLPLKTRGERDGLQPMRDLDQLRVFLAGAGPSALFDLPWTPLYILICYLFHPLIGLAAVIGAIILFAVTLAAELKTRGPITEAVAHTAARNALLDAGRRNAEVLRGMGMASRFAARWSETNAQYLESQRQASDISRGLGSLSRTLRMVLQSSVLGLGAFLVIEEQVTAGIIIASSILVSRALAPVDVAIANWNGFVSARHSWRRLTELLTKITKEGEPLPLPPPVESLTVENVTAVPPGSQKLVVRDVSFKLEKGSALGIIGPNAAGKSSLARLLVGVWMPVRGVIRLDGAPIERWSPERLGPHIGYLPQDVELFDATVAENISRFDPEMDSDAIISAAKNAGVHEMILGLPAGYETLIGEKGLAISAGQRQRIALARALYGDPFLVVLDEPNSNLDTDAEQALTKAILGVRGRGGIAVVIAHRPSVLAATNLVLMLANGQQQAFGPKEEVLRALVRPASSAAKPLPSKERGKGARR